VDTSCKLLWLTSKNAGLLQNFATLLNLNPCLKLEDKFCRCSSCKAAVLSTRLYSFLCVGGGGGRDGDSGYVIATTGGMGQYSN